MIEKKRRMATVINIVMVIFAVTLIVGTIVILGNSREKNYEFTSQKWNECKDEKRHQYIKSLETQYELVGMEREKVGELLGSPSLADKDDKNIKAYEYRISDDILDNMK